MPLTPEDVVTKQFQHVRFKEGFDPDEVDDFLDEIVVEWRKVIAENEELKAKLAAYESGAEAPEASPAAAEVVEEAAAEPIAEVPQAAAPAVAPSVATSASIIDLAQRLHDEHVAEGLAKRDELVAEGQATATRLVSEAEETTREITERFDQERTVLESRISELRQFERDYRAQLRSYIEGKLRDLETTAATSGSSPVSAIGL
ncbi:MAG: DivIVA domain-containing protein [Microbacteriaceae bacterium]|jgi:DivIVA domain-containing protein|nr:DivIVA domain-containing protein [Microbacteriaceae bacterium]HPZ35011.1 DivIVA domain-containing protein [Microbacteriaceae bacterium]